MTIEEQYGIRSEEYADFIIEYGYNPQILESFENAIVHKINEAFAVIHIPLETITQDLLMEFSYSIIPKICGLTSEVSIRASGVERLRRAPAFNMRGSGILIGIIDTGIDYLNPVFQNEDGTTKILSIWDQTIQSVTAYPFNMYYGTEYLEEQINLALISDNPLDIVPSMDYNGHGTMMAGVAAGTENNEAEFQGVAPGAKLVIVKLSQAKQYLRDFYFIPKESAAYQENDIMWGVQYCILAARRAGMPIAICLGLGTSQTSHSGDSNLSNFLSFVGNFTNVGIVVSVGNEGNLGRHFFKFIDPDEESVPVELYVAENERNFSMELWGEAPARYSVDILSPGGEYIPPITAGLNINREISFIFEETVIYISYQLVETLTGNQLILFRFSNISTGIWRFNVYSQTDLPAGFHIWLPMGDFISERTYFTQSDTYTTVLDPGNSFVPIAITAYNPFTQNIYEQASRGYTSLNVVKPELSAPGVNYVAPALNGEFIRYTGTGVAAAHTCGVVALFLEWAVVRGNQDVVNSMIIKSYFIRGAQRDKSLVYPNRIFGYGILDIFNVFDILRTL